jgi:hypothetical protein
MTFQRSEKNFGEGDSPVQPNDSASKPEVRDTSHSRSSIFCHKNHETGERWVVKNKLWPNCCLNRRARRNYGHRLCSFYPSDSE